MAKTVFDDGNASLGILGTIVLAEWLNKVFAHRHTGEDNDGFCARMALEELDDDLQAILAKVFSHDHTGTEDNASPIASDELDGSVISRLVPAGTVIHTAASAAPTGYLKANGAAISRADYAVLFAAIDTTYGAGDGVNTFNLPDLRGEFIRGWDDGRGIDAGRTLGSFQADEFESHNHALPDDVAGVLNIPTLNHSAGADEGYTDLLPTGNRGGTETRPRNIALLACIKY